VVKASKIIRLQCGLSRIRRGHAGRFVLVLSVAFVALVIPFDLFRRTARTNFAVLFLRSDDCRGAGQGLATKRTAAGQAVGSDDVEVNNTKKEGPGETGVTNARKRSEGTRNSKVV
jgi:hypothetical protein